MVSKSRGGTVVRILFKTISWTPVTLAESLTANDLGYAPEGAKRRYEAHFVSKLTDADGLRLVAYGSESENAETETWIDFAHDCKYVSQQDHGLLVAKCHEVGAILGGMMKDASSFILRPRSDLRPLTSDL